MWTIRAGTALPTRSLVWNGREEFTTPLFGKWKEGAKESVPPDKASVKKVDVEPLENGRETRERFCQENGYSADSVEGRLAFRICERAKEDLRFLAAADIRECG